VEGDDDELLSRVVNLEYWIRKDSSGPLLRVFEVLNTPHHGNRSEEIGTDMIVQLDTEELADRLGVSELIEGLDGRPLLKFFYSGLICMRNVYISRPVIGPSYSVGEPDDVWAELCSLDKEISYSYTRAKAISMGLYFGGQEY